MAPTRRPVQIRAPPSSSSSISSSGRTPAPAAAGSSSSSHKHVQHKRESASRTPQPQFYSHSVCTPMDIDGSTQGTPAPGPAGHHYIDLTGDEAAGPVERWVPSPRAPVSAPASTPAPAPAPAAPPSAQPTPNGPEHVMRDIFRRLSTVEQYNKELREGQRNLAQRQGDLEDGVYVSLAELSSRNYDTEQKGQERHDQLACLLNKQVSTLADFTTNLTTRMEKAEEQGEVDREERRADQRTNQWQSDRLFNLMQDSMGKLCRGVELSASGLGPRSRTGSSAGPSSRAANPGGTMSYAARSSPRTAYDNPRDASGRRRQRQSSCTHGRPSAAAAASSSARVPATPTLDTTDAEQTSQSSTYSGTPGSTPPASPARNTFLSSPPSHVARPSTRSYATTSAARERQHQPPSELDAAPRSAAWMTQNRTESISSGRAPTSRSPRALRGA